MPRKLNYEQAKKCMQLIGPFTQLITMHGLPAAGHIKDEELAIIPKGGLLVKEGLIIQIGFYNDLKRKANSFIEIEGYSVGLPGFIDTHTHLCFAGSRFHDYALRVSGMSYQEIAAKGGGILDTVKKTRATSKEELKQLLLARVNKQCFQGITTCEVKSGYGLDVANELKMLEAIQEVGNEQNVTLVPTCLAAHTLPLEYTDSSKYLNHLVEDLLPIVKKRRLAERVDIFIEKGAFSVDEGRKYLEACKTLGFKIVIHADQFSRGGALLAAEVGAISADHLEESLPEDARALKAAKIIPIILPGATLGLGLSFPPAHMLLDHGLPLVIASDWNPGSAPMGNLLTQAALLGAAQKLTVAETFAGITCRAAKALTFKDRGSLAIGKRADFVIFPCQDYREILYYQGSLLPSKIIINGSIC